MSDRQQKALERRRAKEAIKAQKAEEKAERISRIEAEKQSRADKHRELLKSDIGHGMLLESLNQKLEQSNKLLNNIKGTVTVIGVMSVLIVMVSFAGCVVTVIKP